jgi:hypothetical protein
MKPRIRIRLFDEKLNNNPIRISYEPLNRAALKLMGLKYMSQSLDLYKDGTCRQFN